MEEAFIINGGKKLKGQIYLAGSKNAATKMMAASLLTDEEVVLENFPRIGDTEITGELCRSIGSKIKLQGSRLSIKTTSIRNHQVLSLSRKNRIPILTLGPLLSRYGKAEVPVLGGDKIGPRPVNLHIDALTSMGAKIETTESSYKAVAPNGLKGARISFPFPSVGATENAILAGVLARGRTIIYNAATEPEIMDLIKLLQKMGAIIELGANRVIYIDGVKKLHGAVHSVLPDRNEAVSWACLALATNGRVLVEDARQEHLITFLNAVRRIGGEYEVTRKGIIFWQDGDLNGIELETDTHPGFMTDWQQPFVALLTQARGVSVLHETIYEDRLSYIQDLNLLGANIKVFSKCLGELPCRFNGMGCYHSAIISGPQQLKGSRINVRDLRAGMLNIIAALIAKGESTISGVEEIDRGYENIDTRLKSLGADIKRKKIKI